MSTHLTGSEQLLERQKKELEDEKELHQPKISSSTSTDAKKEELTSGHHVKGGEYQLKRDMEKPMKETLKDEEGKSIAPDSHITHESTHQIGSTSHTNALRVYDVTGGTLLEISGSEVAKFTVGWLRKQIAEKIKERGIGGTTTDATGGSEHASIKPADEKHIFLYQHYGDWLNDDIPLLKLEGDRVMFLCYFPHGDEAYKLHLKMLPSGHSGRILTVAVTDHSTIHLIKSKIAAEYKIAIAHQRILFDGRLLEDNRTVESYKLPPESTLELDLISF